MSDPNATGLTPPANKGAAVPGVDPKPTGPISGQNLEGLPKPSDDGFYMEDNVVAPPAPARGKDGEEIVPEPGMAPSILSRKTKKKAVGNRPPVYLRLLRPAMVTGKVCNPGEEPFDVKEEIIPQGNIILVDADRADELLTKYKGSYAFYGVRQDEVKRYEISAARRLTKSEAAALK